MEKINKIKHEALNKDNETIKSIEDRALANWMIGREAALNTYARPTQTPSTAKEISSLVSSGLEAPELKKALLSAHLEYESSFRKILDTTGSFSGNQYPEALARLGEDIGVSVEQEVDSLRGESRTYSSEDGSPIEIAPAEYLSEACAVLAIPDSSFEHGWMVVSLREGPDGSMIYEGVAIGEDGSITLGRAHDEERNVVSFTDNKDMDQYGVDIKYISRENTKLQFGEDGSITVSDISSNGTDVRRLVARTI